MRAQRPVDAASALDAVAEHLPFDDDAFDAVMAVVTIHQWRDVDRGLREMRRVARGPVIVLTFDAAALQGFWLTEYLPQVMELEQQRFPAIDRVTGVLAGGRGRRSRGRPGAQRPRRRLRRGVLRAARAFLRPEVRAATSGIALIDPDAVRRGLDRLRRDLASGEWDRRWGFLREQPEHAGAVRLITSRPRAEAPGPA